MEFLIVVLLIVIFIFSIFLPIHQAELRKKQIILAVRQAADSAKWLSVQEFFALREEMKRNGFLNSPLNFQGVYILHNITKDKNYVGQAQKIFNRVNQHFTGKGNGDVYFDYRSGDVFTIKMIELSKSGFSSLNELESSAIFTYKAYERGYNKNRGIRH